MRSILHAFTAIISIFAFVQHSYAVSISHGSIEEYPNTVKNIESIYNSISSIKNDDFTSNEEYMSKLSELLSRNNLEEYVIFKITPFIVGVTKHPSFSYNVNNGNLKLFLWNETFHYITGSKSLTTKAYTVLSKTSKKNQTGVNAFGVSGSYKMETGVQYALLFSKYKSILDRIDIEIKNISTYDARSLEKNMEIFFVIKFDIFSEKPIAMEYRAYEQARLDRSFAYDKKIRALQVDLKAILVCDKSQKKIIKTMYF